MGETHLVRDVGRRRSHISVRISTPDVVRGATSGGKGAYPCQGTRTRGGGGLQWASGSGRSITARSRPITPRPPGHALLVTRYCSRPPTHALLLTPLRPGTAPTRYPPIPTSASYVRDAVPTLREVTARAARRSCPGRDVGPDGGAARMHLGFQHALRTSPVPFPLRRRNARTGLPGRRSRAELARRPRPCVDVEPQDVR